MKHIHILHPNSFLGEPEEFEAINNLTHSFSRLTVSTTMHQISQNEQAEINDSSHSDSALSENHTVVIPRFRSIPFGSELEEEVELHGGELINSFQQHRNIANIRNWAGLLRKETNINLCDNLTAEVFSVSDIPNLPDDEYFIKGETNSKKNDFFNSSYANRKEYLFHIVNNLQKDHYIGTQEVVIRPFQKFRKLGEAVDNRPIFNERRVFILDGKIMSEAYYWSSFPEWQHISDESVKDGTMLGEEYYRALNDAIEATKHLARFYVIDMAELDPKERSKRIGENPDAYSWQVVELNDGCMSGTSENNPTELWNNIITELRK